MGTHHRSEVHRPSEPHPLRLRDKRQALPQRRDLGKPAFVTSQDVVAALIREGVLDRPPGGKRDLAAIQEAFNAWSGQSGRNLTEISRILAMSIGADGHGGAARR